MSSWIAWSAPRRALAVLVVLVPLALAVVWALSAA
ncbi:MAG: hypothetical protein JWM77_973 [Rhodospirillales bacterium]|jgi:hypothetical protein|nr:hypothetical protein [Rhodospirillales bacterium]